MADNPIKHSDIIQDGNPFDDTIKGLEELLKLFKKLDKELKTTAKDYLKFIQKQNAGTKEGKKNIQAVATATQKLTVQEKEALKVKRLLEREQAKANLLQDKNHVALLKSAEAQKIANRATERAIKSQAAGAKSTNRWGKALGSFQFKFNALGNLIANFASNIARQFVRSVRQAITTITDFGQAAADVGAISGATDKQLKELTKTARKLGGTTKFTATQVLGLQKELAKLGFTTEEILDAQKAILSFSAATGADLSEAAKTAGVAVRAFGLNASETNDAVATMAVATTKSALAFADFETILSTVGPVARSFGFTLEETVALTGRLRDAGFDASKSATATRNILLNLADANGELAKSLGGPVKNFDELIDGLIELNDEGVSLAQTLELTDKRSVAAFNQFLVAAESARELKGEITDVNGELQEMVDKRLDTLAGDVDLLKSAWKEFILSLSEDGGILRSTVQLLTNFVLEINNLDLAISKFNKQTGEQLERSFALLQALTNKQGTQFQSVLKKFSGLTVEELEGMKSEIIDQFNDVRKVNKKEAAALFEEFVRQRKLEIETAATTEAEKGKRIEEEQSRLDKNRKAGDKIRIEEVKEFIDEEIKLEELSFERKKNIYQENLDFRKEADKRFAAEDKAAKKKQAEDDKKIEDEKQAKIQATFDLANRLTSTFTDIFAKQKEKELSAVGDNAEKRAEIEKKFARKEQALAISQAIIDGAAAIVKLGAQLGVAAPPFQIASAALTAAQIGIIASQKFGEGEVDIDGPSHSRGGIAAEIEGGESVINKRSTAKYGNLLEAINANDSAAIADAALQNQAFHEVWGRSRVNNESAKNSSDPYTKKMWEAMMDTPTIIPKGPRTERYPGGKTRIITNG